MLEEIYGKVKPMTMLKRSFKNYTVYGYDTETPDYTIKLLSISDPDGHDRGLFDVTSETILDTFLDFFRPRVKNGDIVLFAHNLSFDFLVLLNLDLKEEDCQFLSSECHWRYMDARINYFNDKPHFGEIVFDNGGKLFLRDTFSFFGRIKLSVLAEALQVGHKIKIDKDDFYNKKSAFKKKFREYALEDARLTAAIGEKIMEYHAMEDVSLSVSGPQMAMQVFRKNYIPFGKELTPPDFDHLRYWELSYHGGMNGCYILTPKELKDCYLYDINSAYPFAMCEIPSFLNCRYSIKEGCRKIQKGKVGIYQVQLISTCPFNSTYDHDFTPLKMLNGQWITSYELESLIDHGCIEELKIMNAMFVEPRNEYNPLEDYARHYYKLKSETPKTSPMYLYYKVCMLNSLYGKFIERRYDSEKEYAIRGPNYNPAIASLITGHTRAYMHGLEHQTNAIHAATDSVFTLKKMKTKTDLGGVSLEGFGTLKLLRTKLYMFYDKKGERIKYAMHGFHGTIEQLEDMWKNRKWKYTFMKMPTAGEYFLHKKLKLRLFGMNKMESQLNVDWRNLDG